MRTLLVPLPSIPYSLCGLRLIISIVLLPLALFGAAVLLTLFPNWQEMLPQKYERSLKAGLPSCRAALTKQEEPNASIDSFRLASA